MKYKVDIPTGLPVEAPRGGAGIEMFQSDCHTASTQKPLVEGLVLKLSKTKIQQRNCEAPRGGAGIEIAKTLASSKITEAPRGGAGIEITKDLRE